MLLNTETASAATSRGRSTSAANPASVHQQMVARAAKVGMFTERMTITPQQALYILERHAPQGTNRSISAPKVAALTAQMAAGLWNPSSHQGIAFRTDGVLTDGQHRLTACVNSGTPITTLVTYGQPADVFAVLDQGTQRTGAHILQAAGLHVPSVNHVAAAARQLIILTDPDMAPSEAARAFNKASLVPFIRQHNAAVVLAVQRARAATQAIRNRIPVTPLAAALFMIAAKADTARIDVFCEALGRGASLEEDSPVLVLRNALISGTAAQGYRSVDDRSRAITGAIINAWNLWTARRKARSFKPISYKRADPFPEPRA